MENEIVRNELAADSKLNALADSITNLIDNAKK